ncbi:hypothetical protein [Paenibacillus sambharensis]|nr:hypothetical protein [Paenibacillus sambharensis]
MIEMEPMECAVDERTYSILDSWFGREMAGKLLYEGKSAYEVGQCTNYTNSLLKSANGL